MISVTKGNLMNKYDIDSGLYFRRKYNSMGDIRENIDRQAEREANALHKQGQYTCQQHKRQRIETDHNKAKFNKLFWK